MSTPIRGHLEKNATLAPYTWFRVGGPADTLFLPADSDDLAAFLKICPPDEQITVIGVGSNLLVRDAGVRGTVIRLGPAFGRIEIDGNRVRAGAGALDATVARRAAAAGIAGLEFMRGIPGTIGGALRMNAGAYGGDVAGALVSLSAIDRRGALCVVDRSEIDFLYRSNPLPTDLIFVDATFQGTHDDPKAIEDRMADIMARREQSQPVREKTGGSTFKNPDPVLSGGRSAWQLIDAVGGRGRTIGGAQMSSLHCNFMINLGHATAADLESLGESLRADVAAAFGVSLEWEIKRIGEPS